jgi:hypothetical protein
MRKLLMPIQGDVIAPRFDMATEILVAHFDHGKLIGEPKIMIMERPSEESLCQMAVEENITDFVCGGIEEVHYKFLVWKKVNALDRVIGRWRTALEKILDGTLSHGEIVHSKSDGPLTL